MDDEASHVLERIRAKEELVRKLRLVKVNRIKHDPGQLERVTSQWTEACVQALNDLCHALNQQSSNPDSQVSMEELLRHLGIEPKLVGYSVENESFSEPLVPVINL